jgi:hypothetical protein
MDAMDGTNWIIDDAWAEFAPVLDRLDRPDRVEFLDAWTSAVGRFEDGKIRTAEFRAIVRELGRDARGTAHTPDAGDLPDLVTVLPDGTELDGYTDGREVPPVPFRDRWAVLPVWRVWVAALVLPILGALFMIAGQSLAESFRAPAPVPAVEPGGRFGTPRITLDLERLPSSDCWYEVTMTDTDGEPGGPKVAHVAPLCP